MRPFFKVLIIVYAAIAIGLIGLLIFLIHTGGIRTNNFSIGGNLKLVNTQSIKLEGIETLKIKYRSDDVVVYASDSDELILKEYMSFTPKEEDLTQITKSGKELSLEGKRDGWNGLVLGFNRSSRMEIYLPAGYENSLYISTASGNIESDLRLKVRDFAASTASGDIEFNEVTGENLNISSASGSVTFKKAEGNRKLTTSSGDIKVYGGSGKTEISSTSGSIYVENSIGDFEAGTSSGDIKVEGTIGRKEIHSTSGVIILENSEGYIKAYTSSGDIRIRNSNGAGDFHSTSGQIDVEFSKDISSITDNINVETSSGDVTMRVPASLAFEFNASTSSGDINFFNDQISYSKNNKKATATVGTAPIIQLTVKTTSGEIKINNK
ncbi:MAG: hypothetical protein K0R05_4180 [Anaerocolumna sp.]|nr:hypothetical protein [Anaerocolumna sp.]